MLPGLNLEQPDTRPFTKHKIGSKPNLEVQMFKEVSNQNSSEYSSYTFFLFLVDSNFKLDFYLDLNKFLNTDTTKTKNMT